MLLVNNLKEAKLPLALKLNFPTYKDLKYYEHPETKKLKKRTEAHFAQANDLLTDSFRQIEQLI